MSKSQNLKKSKIYQIFEISCIIQFTHRFFKAIFFHKKRSKKIKDSALFSEKQTFTFRITKQETQSITKELVAVICHDGNTPFEGHYITYARNIKISQWWCYDDDQVSSV